MYIDEENNNVFIIEKLNRLKNDLNQEDLDLRRIQKEMNELDKINTINSYAYMETLLDPINKKCVKVPSEKPLPSCTFQLHDNYKFRPNSKGNALIGFNPWLLVSDDFLNRQYRVGEYNYSMVMSSLGYFFCPDEQVDGSYECTNWYVPSSVNFTIPAVYSQYRLVSAALTIKYLGQIDEASGLIGGAVTFDKVARIGARMKQEGTNNARSSRIPEYYKYGNFENIRDSYYYKEHSCLEGLKMLYFPIDNSFQEFKRVCDGSNLDIKVADNLVYISDPGETQMKSGFNWIVYLLNLPPTSSVRVDWYLNFECLPKSELLNYIPISLDVFYISPELIKDILEKVRDNVIQALNS